MLLASFFTTIGMDEQPIDYFFGIHHLIYFFIFIFAFVITFKVIRKKEIKQQDLFINIALVLILFLKYITELLFIYEYHNVSPAYSSYPHPFLDVNTFFSFQLCGVMNVILPFVIWFNIKPLKPFVYLTSILGGLAVVFYPVTVLFGDPFIITLPMVRSSIIHFFLVLIPILMIYRGDIKITKNYWYHIVIGFLTIAAWAMVGNLFIDKTANNMYIMSNPFLNGPIPILNSIPSGWHTILLTIMVSIGYFMTYHLAKLFQKKLV